MTTRPSLHFRGAAFAIPKGWKDRSQTYATGPVAGGITPTLTITEEALDKGEDFERYSQRHLEAVAALIGEPMAVKDLPRRLGARAGLWRELNFTVAQKALTQLQFLTPEGKSAVRVYTVTDSKTKAAAAKKLLETMVASGAGKADRLS